MSEILIFGGTSEGRMLAEFCADNGIPADVCVVTQTGDDLIARRKGLSVHVGALDEIRMRAMMAGGRYRLVVDATHPYAKEATENIRAACRQTSSAYLRVKRESEPVEGLSFDTLNEMTAFLNAGDESAAILSALGGKSLAALRAVHGWRERLWARVLPSETIAAEAAALGYPAEHIIMEKGPFSVPRNIAHLQRSGARYLLTKESGRAGGYPEKVGAAAACGVTVLTLRRKPEEGVTVQEAMKMIREGCRAGGI